MPDHSIFNTPVRLIGRALLVAGTLGAVLTATGPATASAQDTPDPDDLVEEARDRQIDFEMFRGRHTMMQIAGSGRPISGCDERIVRVCIYVGGAGAVEAEPSFPPERSEVREARRGLIGVLIETDEHADHPWVTGQLVHYLVEEGDHRMAERIATECEIPQGWWCSALLGYSLHVREEFIEAEEAFRTALATMPDETYERWTGGEYIFTRDGERFFDDLGGPERTQTWEMFWRLSDPLFLVPGNDRLTDHYARWVEVLNREDAEHPQGIFWDIDLAETLVRYGRSIGYSGSANRRGMPRAGRRFQIQDNKNIVAHQPSGSRGYIFPEEFLPSPSNIPPETWITAPREAWSWYVPPYAPDFRGLETQVGRFRRAEDMLVIGAYKPLLTQRRVDPDGTVTVSVDPFETVEGPVESALFLVPEEGGEAEKVGSDDPQGVFTLRAPPGRYVSSMEVFDRRGERAWRARQGVKQDPLVPGLVGVSDLLILDRGAPFPDSLDQAIPHVRPGVRVGSDESFIIVWEVYGLQIDEPVEVTVGLTAGRPEFMADIGEFLEEVELDRPVEITFTDPGPDRVARVFRALELDLPDLAPGDYTLHVRLDLQGREPVFASRPIVVEG